MKIDLYHMSSTWLTASVLPVYINFFSDELIISTSHDEPKSHSSCIAKGFSVSGCGYVTQGKGLWQAIWSPGLWSCGLLSLWLGTPPILQVSLSSFKILRQDLSHLVNEYNALFVGQLMYTWYSGYFLPDSRLSYRTNADLRNTAQNFYMFNNCVGFIYFYSILALGHILRERRYFLRRMEKTQGDLNEERMHETHHQAFILKTFRECGVCTMLCSQS